jgi:hypothetical protein
MLLLPVSAVAAAAPSYHIVLSQPRAGAGEDVFLSIVPPPDPGVRVRWRNAVDRHMTPGEATYNAPFVIVPGAPPARVEASISGPGFQTIAAADIKLLPGSAEGSDECLGPGQSYSPEAGTMEPDERPLDRAPEYIGSADPFYPPGESFRAMDDTILVSVLVCRTGRVISAFAVPTYASPFDRDPVPHDPVMVDAALIAVRKYMFMPASRDGQPVAAWTAVRVPPRP